MTDHEHLKRLISAYIDGETNPQETEMVERALAQDADLKKYYQDLKKLSSSLETWPNQDLSPDLEQKIERAFRARKAKEEGQDMKSRIPLTAFATLMIAIVVLSFSLQIYVKRGVQGRWKTSADHIGEQYSPGNTQYTSVQKQTLPVTGVSMTQYEPYYLTTRGTVEERKVALDVVSTRSRDVKGYQSSSYDPALGIIEEKIGQFNPSQDWNTEQYNRIYENEYLEVTQNPLSTFSIDVDTASYSNVRRFLTQGQMPPEDSVRIEEMINYFSYNYPEPTGDDPFSITTEVAPCPWNPDHQVALVGLQGKRLQSKDMPPSNLVFLIDVSGSMNEPNKLPLLKQSFRMMVQQLRAEDKISIVVYAGAAGKVLDPTPGDQKQTILNAIDNLQAGGSTAGGAGIQLAYELAKTNFIKDGNNRVVLATDGDFNIGVSSDGELTRIIEEKRKDGIFLTVLGFGTGNYKDAKMEQLADKGNGNYYYIDNLKEGKKVLVQELGSALFAIAKDVKIQIEFNPGQVKAYRLVGYENRVLAKEDFNDDTKDAGELGTGHTVTALYEIVPAGSQEKFGQVDELKYQTTQVKNTDDVMTVKLRYKKPNEDTSKLLSRVVSRNDIQAGMSENLAWASSVAEFGMILRNSKFKGQAAYSQALQQATAAKGQDPWGLRQEMIDLIRTAESLDTRSLSGQGSGISTK